MTKAHAPAALTGKQVRYLRGLGHSLDPVIHVGKGGLSDALAAEAGHALLAHELIKVKILGEAPVDRNEAAEALATATGAALVQVLGRTFLLYKRHPQKPKIVLPAKEKSKPAAKTRPANTSAEDSTSNAENDADDGDVANEEENGP